MSRFTEAAELTAEKRAEIETDFWRMAMRAAPASMARIADVVRMMLGAGGAGMLLLAGVHLNSYPSSGQELNLIAGIVLLAASLFTGLFATLLAHKVQSFTAAPSGEIKSMDSEAAFRYFIDKMESEMTWLERWANREYLVGMRADPLEHGLGRALLKQSRRVRRAVLVQVVLMIASALALVSASSSFNSVAIWFSLYPA